MKAAEARKAAAGLRDTGENALEFTSGEQIDRAVFSGFDIDYDELISVVENVGSFLTMQACQSHPLIPLFRASWTEGFLVGLMVHNPVAPHHAPPDSGSDIGSGGESGDPA